MLIQKPAQSRQFIVVAQIFGRNDLIELRCIGLIIESRRHIGHGPIGAHGHHALLAHIVGAFVAVGVEVVAILALALLALAALVLGARFGVHVAVARLLLAGFALFLLVLLILAILVRFRFFGIGRYIGVDQLQMLQHGRRQRLEGALVVDRQHQRIKVGTRLVLDPLIDHGDAGRGVLGDRLPGQPLAHLERQGGGQRHFVGRACPADRVRLQP